MFLKRALTVLFLGLITLSAAHTQAPPPNPAPLLPSQIESRPLAYFVELHGHPTSEGGSLAALAAEKQAFRGAAQNAGVRYRERLRFDKLFNGFSVEVPATDVPKLARLPEVKAVYPVHAIPVPEVVTGPEPNLATALAMTQADIAQNELGLTGRGIRVAIVDSGIDYDHLDLGGCFGPGCRVEVGYDFVGDAFNANPNQPTYNPVAVPDPLPDDCLGHGTHVAGIVGANGQVRGVAPEVTFGAYRIFGCTGSGSSDIIVAALERVLEDGADIVNMSLGSDFAWPDDPIAKAADRLVQKGIVVVGSIGNSGSFGLYSGGGPALGQNVIGVASFDNTHFNLSFFRAAPDGYPVIFFPASNSSITPGSGTVPLARTATGTACDATAPAPGSLAGKAVLIRFTSCSLNEQARNAQAAGAAALIFYNPDLPFIQIPTSVGGPSPVTIPAVIIFQEDGALLEGRLADGPVDVTWTTELLSFPNPSGGLINSGSAYGVAPDLTLKPDLGAPGGLIRSTYPLELGGYSILSGTSMASPHVAGAVALLLQARPHTPPTVVRALLQNTASPQPWWGNPGLGFLDNTHRQGAGLLRMADAIRSTARVEPSKLSLGESESGPAVRTLTVQNAGPAAVTYNLSHSPALSTGPNTFTPEFFDGFASVAFSTPSLTVPAGSSATVTATITANPELPDRSLYGGYLVLTPQSGGPALRVPYSGFKGDYQSIQVLKPTPFDFPWLVKLTPAGLFNQPGGAVYTMVGDDIPGIAVHLDHPAQEVRLEVFDADTGKAWHRISRDRHTPRNSTADDIFLFPWDGTTQGGNKTYVVPDGRYVIKMTVIKALGDATNPAHVETWTSPVVTIDRP